MLQRTLLFTWLLVGCLGPLLAQDDNEVVYQTFKDTRVINVHSVETLAAGRMDVRIAHRFGDLAGENGGWPTFFGLENATDIMIGAEYGFSERLTAGIFRTKGAGFTPRGDPGLRQMINLPVKYRLLRQTTQGSDFSPTAVLTTSMSTAPRVEGGGDLVQSFPKFSHRFAFNGQLVLARKFSPKFSLQLIPGYTHRNLVPFGDMNGIFSLAAATRIQLTRVFGLVADLTVPFSEQHSTTNGYYPALGLGLEIETGGHVFQVNFTNATALIETDFIPYTTTNWLDGAFRLGFTVSRWFNL